MQLFCVHIWQLMKNRLALAFADQTNHVALRDSGLPSVPLLDNCSDFKNEIATW